MNTWNRFKKWIANNDHCTSYDFKEMMHSMFKIANGDSTCRCETDERTYEYCERKEDSEIYFETIEPHQIVEWKGILGQKFKSGVVKIISTLGVEVATSTETVDQPFCTKNKELLKAGKVITACDVLVKNGVMGVW